MKSGLERASGETLNGLEQWMQITINIAMNLSTSTHTILAGRPKGRFCSMFCGIVKVFRLQKYEINAGSFFNYLKKCWFIS